MIDILLSSVSEMFHKGDVFHILLILLASSWIIGQIFKYYKLPMVLGDILAGVILSPLFLIAFDNQSAEEVITILAGLGVFFMMLHSGMDTNSDNLSAHIKSSFFIALAGIIPIASSLFFLFSYFLDLPTLSVLFLSLVLCINSIPVLVAFLQHHGLKKKLFGHLVIGSTMVNELLLFFLLSLIIIFAEQGNIDLQSIIIIIVKITVFAVSIYGMGKYLFPLFHRIFNETKKKAFTMTMIVGLMIGLMAEMIGLHIILGAYLGGMLVRKQMQNEFIFKKVEDRLYGISYSFLGPIFFVSVGLAISFEGIFLHPWLFLSTFIIVLGMQVLGSGFMVRYFYPEKFTKKTSSALALTLAGRGGTEIIVAQIGSTTLISGLSVPLLPVEYLSFVVLIAFFSTLLIPFCLRWLLKK